MQAMSKATFYLLPNAAQQPSAEQLQLLACQLAGQHYAKGEWLYIHCEDQAQAHGIDELLWQFEPSAFVPHNLKGEGPAAGAPVEIGFDRLGPNQRRPILINLANEAPAFAVNFGRIIDFVAGDEQHKALARDRYRQYRNLGVTLSTQDLATQPLKFV